MEAPEVRYPHLLAVEDMAGRSEDDIKSHIIGEWRPVDEYKEQLTRSRLLIAYESVGSWGCDSSGFYLFEDNGALYEACGSHCSCYGFEDQWKPEITTRAALEIREFYLGGYDSNPGANGAALKEYVKTLPPEASYV